MTALAQLKSFAQSLPIGDRYCFAIMIANVIVPPLVALSFAIWGV